MTTTQEAYADICKRECEWCAKRIGFFGDRDRGAKHDCPYPSALQTCTAPTRDQVIERLSCELAAERESSERRHKWNQVLAKSLDGVNQELEAERERLRLATEALKVYANTGDINSGTPNIARWALAQLTQPAPVQPAPEKEWRAVHIKDGYAVAPDRGDPKGWVDHYPSLYRLEWRTPAGPWTNAEAPKEKPNA